MATFVNTYVTGTASVNDLNVTGAFDLASITLTDTTNQIDMGAATFNTIINAPAKAATSTYTIPDVGVTSNFAMTAGAQTFTGVKTLTTPQILDSDASHSYIVGVSDLTANRTVTLPLLLGNDTFTLDSFGATLSNKTLAAPVTTGQVSNALGSAAAPSLTFTGDLNTGIFSSGANAVDVATNGVARLTVNDTGASLGVGSLLNTVNVADKVTLVSTATLAITLANASRNLVVTNAAGSTIALPNGTGFDGVTYTICRVNVTGATVINASGSDKIDDGVLTTLSLSSQYQRVTLTYIQSQLLWIIV